MSNAQAAKNRVDLEQGEFTRLYGLAYGWHKNLFARDLCYEDWQELASETVYRLVAAMERGKYDNRKASVDTYLRSVARNLAIDHHRRSRRRLSRVLAFAEGFDTCDPHADEALDAAVESLSYQQLLREFGPDIDTVLERAGLTLEQQAAFKMNVLTDMTSRDVGSVLGVSAEAVRSRILASRRKLEAFRERIARETKCPIGVRVAGKLTPPNSRRSGTKLAPGPPPWPVYLRQKPRRSKALAGYSGT